LHKATEPKSFDALLAEQQLREAFWNVFDALRGSVRSILGSDLDAEQKGQMIDESVTQFGAKIKGFIPSYQPEVIEAAARAEDLRLSVQEALIEENDPVAKLQKVAGLVGVAFSPPEPEGATTDVQKGAGQEPEPPPADETPSEAPGDQVSTEALAKSLAGLASAGDLAKVQATLDHLAGQIEGLNKSQAQVEELTGDLAQAQETLATIEERLTQVEAQPAGEGPVLRQVTPNGDPSASSRQRLSKGAAPAGEIDALEKMIDAESNPLVREALGKRRALLLLRANPQA
jgi:hypothetical protein